MINAEPFVEQPVLSFDLVVIVVFRKPHPEPIGRLGRATMADRVRQDDEVLGGVERLVGGRTGARRIPASATRRRRRRYRAE
jgi:hypothetical protein